MNKQMGIILILSGAILMGIGFFVTFFNKNQDKIVLEKVDATHYHKDLSFHDREWASVLHEKESGVASQTAKDSRLNSSSRSELSQVRDDSPKSNQSVASEKCDPKQKGNDFEGYVADILKANNIRLKEWNQGPTSPNGAYADNELNPDFRVVDGDKNLEYWVECKYRTSIPPNGFTIETNQLSRYHSIQGMSKRKVLIALGVGGSPTSPHKFYLIPLDTMLRFKRVGPNFLPNYSLTNPQTDFKRHVSHWFFNEVFKK